MTSRRWRLAQPAAGERGVSGPAHRKEAGRPTAVRRLSAHRARGQGLTAGGPGGGGAWRERRLFPAPSPGSTAARALRAGRSVAPAAAATATAATTTSTVMPVSACSLPPRADPGPRLAPRLHRRSATRHSARAQAAAGAFASLLTPSLPIYFQLLRPSRKSDPKGVLCRSQASEHRSCKASRCYKPNPSLHRRGN